MTGTFSARSSTRGNARNGGIKIGGVGGKGQHKTGRDQDIIGHKRCTLTLLRPCALLFILAFALVFALLRLSASDRS